MPPGFPLVSYAFISPTINLALVVNWSVRTSKHHPQLNLTLSSADLLHVYGSTSFRLKPAAEKYPRNPRFLQASTASAYTLGSWAPDSPGSKLSPSFRWSESSPGRSPALQEAPAPRLNGPSAASSRQPQRQESIMRVLRFCWTPSLFLWRFLSHTHAVKLKHVIEEPYIN